MISINQSNFSLFEQAQALSISLNSEITTSHSLMHSIDEPDDFVTEEEIQKAADQVGWSKVLTYIDFLIKRQSYSDYFNSLQFQSIPLLVRSIALSLFRVGACGEISARGFLQAAKFSHVVRVTAFDTIDKKNHSFLILHSSYEAIKKIDQLARKEIGLSDFFDSLPSDAVVLDPFLKCVCAPKDLKNAGNDLQRFIQKHQLKVIDPSYTKLLLATDEKLIGNLQSFSDNFYNKVREEIGLGREKDLFKQNGWYKYLIEYAKREEQVLEHAFPRIKWTSTLIFGEVNFFSEWQPREKAHEIEEWLVKKKLNYRKSTRLENDTIRFKIINSALSKGDDYLPKMEVAYQKGLEKRKVYDLMQYWYLREGYAIKCKRELEEHFPNLPWKPIYKLKGSDDPCVHFEVECDQETANKIEKWLKEQDIDYKRVDQPNMTAMIKITNPFPYN